MNYIVAHGISSYIKDKKVVIGSYHFVFEDEKCRILPEFQEKFQQLSEAYSHLYLAIDNVLAAVICIEDPLREEAPEVIRGLRKAGFKKIVMMTGAAKKLPLPLQGEWEWTSIMQRFCRRTKPGLWRRRKGKAAKWS